MIRISKTGPPCKRCGDTTQTTKADLNLKRWMSECEGCGVFIRTWEMAEGEVRLMELQRRVNQRV